MSRQASGLRAWMLQRISALYLGLYFPVTLVYLLLHPVEDYAAWIGLISNAWINSSLLLFFLALLFHAWVGVRDVVIDYIHPFPLRFGVLVALALFLIGCGFWVMDILFNVRAA